MYISPSFEAIALTAEPYRGKGLDCGVGKFRRRCDHGYNAALGGWPPIFGLCRDWRYISSGRIGSNLDVHQHLNQPYLSVPSSDLVLDSMNSENC